MNLSDHLTLNEMLRSSKAQQLGIDNNPSVEIISALSSWAQNLFEPLRAQFGPLLVTSGYRCPKLNAAVGGAADSAHVFGCAGDLQPLDPRFTARDLVGWVADRSGLLYDQVIFEHPAEGEPWCHLGSARPGMGPARQMALDWSGGKYVGWVPAADVDQTPTATGRAQ